MEGFILIYMESQKVDFESTDVTFHSRDFRPTRSFARAQEKARTKDSKVVRVYGIPRLVIDTETKLMHLGFQFSEDITRRIQNGELVMQKNTPWTVDEETQKKIADKEKRRLKNSTRVWRKDS